MAGFLLIGAIALLTVVYYFINNYYKGFGYFKEQGIPYLKPEFLYGNTRNLAQKKMCNAEFYRDIYEKFKKMGVKHGGIFDGQSKIWVPIDPELVKAIMTKDYDYFSAHNPKFPGLFFNNLFHMNGEEWKDMRRKLTPTFTSGKMKMMYDIVLQKSHGLVNLVGEKCKDGETAEIKALVARYTTDVIGNCAFGIECNSMENEESEFFRQGQNVFKPPKMPSPLNFMLWKMGLMKLNMTNFKPIEDFFRGIVEETVKHREDNKITRKDFMHLMIQLKNKGCVTELMNENEDVFEKTIAEEVMTVEDIAGECILFFTAGFETSSTTMSYVLLELTQNQDVQQKLRKEIRRVMKEHDGKLTYEALQEITYLDHIIHETLRKYPPVGTIPRQCTKTYRIPDTNSYIEKGIMVQIPAWGLQMDPDYFPDPEKFDPDRHLPENKSKIRPFTNLPFGEGPRLCIGMRFGVMQSKAGLANLINNYNFTLNKKTLYPPVFHKSTYIITVDGGIWLNATKVD